MTKLTIETGVLTDRGAIEPALDEMLLPGTDIAPELLAWYDRNRRVLPWRALPGESSDPYAVWLSEVMLQQTTVKAVAPFYEKFLSLWPTVNDLAAAEEEDVLRAWAGLGYYSRARNMHACAKTVVAEHGGQFPASEADLLKLPGIGPYTAAAIAAIAFNLKATPVDGNIERVVCRLNAVTTPLPNSKPELKRLAALLVPEVRAGDYAQAMMDLGATVCTPKRPNCMLCPLSRGCAARLAGLEAVLPYRQAKKAKPVRRGIVFFAMKENGHVLLRKRASKGLLANMIEVPSSDWQDVTAADDDAGGASDPLKQVPVKASWWAVPGEVTHTFTHFKLELSVYRAIVPNDAELSLWADAERCRWVHRSKLKHEALPSLMTKVIHHALEGLG